MSFPSDMDWPKGEREARRASAARCHAMTDVPQLNVSVAVHRIKQIVETRTPRRTD